jgi:hypothetical protein
MSFTHNSVPYLEQLSERAKKARSVEQIEAAIRDKGYWEDFVEWRISTVTSMRIEPVERDRKRWYRVQVKCDAEFICHCPTVERAVEFLGVFERLTADLFWTLGWPGWAAPNKLEP